MKEFLIALVLMLACGIACGAEQGAWFGDGPQPTADQPAAQPANVEADAAAAAAGDAFIASLRRDSQVEKDMRELGLNRRTVRRAVWTGLRDGTITSDMTKREVANAVFLSAMLDNPRVAADIGDNDDRWDRIIEAIERIIELIMRLIPLFS